MKPESVELALLEVGDELRLEEDGTTGAALELDASELAVDGVDDVVL